MLTPPRHAEMHFLVPRYPQSHRSRNPKNPKIPNSKTPNIQTSKNSSCFFARFRRCEIFWVFGFLDFSGSDSSDLWISGHQDLHFHVPQVRRLDNATIYICRIYTYVYAYIYIYIYTKMCMNTRYWLNQAFAAAEGYLANRIVLHCLVPICSIMMIVKALIIVHCVVPVLVPVWIFTRNI